MSTIIIAQVTWTLLSSLLVTRARFNIFKKGLVDKVGSAKHPVTT